MTFFAQAHRDRRRIVQAMESVNPWAPDAVRVARNHISQINGLSLDVKEANHYKRTGQTRFNGLPLTR